MDFTGERPTTGSGKEGSIMRYHSISSFCHNKTVLDYGCGIGIGTKYLSKYCKKIIGWEPCKEALKEAQQDFIGENVTYIESMTDLKDNIDITCMVEVIEHIEKPEVIKLLEKIKSDLIGTTPNGNLFPYHPMSLSERRGYHVWHYTYQELYDLLNKFFSYVEVYGAIWDPRIAAFTSLNFIAKHE